MGSNLQESRNLAKTQADFSRQIAELQAQLSQVNQQTPWGSLIFGGTPENRTATVNLTPEQQRIMGRQQIGQWRALGAGNDLLGGFNNSLGALGQFSLANLLPAGMNFSADRNKVTNSVFQQALNLLRPVWQQQDRSREQQLANRGLPISGTAYQTDRSNTARDRNNTLNQLAMQAVLAGGQEQSRQLQNVLNTSQIGYGQGLTNRQQTLANALSLLGTGGVQAPQFGNYGVPVSPVQVQSFATQGQGAAPLGSGLGMLLGAGLGGFLGGPGGATAGAQAGGGLGGIFGSIF